MICTLQTEYLEEGHTEMTNQKTPSLPDTSCWQAQSLRVTAFPSPSATISQPKWWSELFGTEPEVRNLRPARGEHVETGPFDKGTLTLQINPIRIDWILTVNQNAILDEMPYLGAFPEIGDTFMKLMAEWLALASAPLIQRLAFGAMLNQKVGGREEGYNLLSRYLPNVRLSPESTDFLYQINRPRKSNVPSMTTHSINRLSKWSSISIHRTLIQSLPDGTTNSSLIGETGYACNLELDISTAADFKGELPQQALAQIVREQYDWGMEVASMGDIA